MFAILLRVFKAPHRKHVAILLGVVGAVVLIGAGLFALAESLPFTTGLYWAVTTATTVGYGDITPHNPIGRLIASLVMLTTIPMLAAAFALVSGAAAAAGVRRILTMRTEFPEGTYRLVIGMNPIVPALIAELSRARIPVVLVADVAPETLPDVHVVRGDPTDEKVIAKAKPAGAEQALITGASDGDVLVSAVLLRKQAPSVPVTALVTSPSIREALRDLGIEQSVSASELVSRTLAASLETPHAGELISQLVGKREALAEIEMTESAFGKRLSAIRNEHADLVLGLVHGSQFTLGIGDDPVVTAGDRLLIAKADAPAAVAVAREGHR